MNKLILKIKLILIFFTAILVFPATASAAFTCSNVWGCPSGDAALGVNFAGLQPSDLGAGSFTVSTSGSNGYSCDYSSGTAGNSSSCTAYYNSGSGNIECLIEHMDCRNNPFYINVSAPAGYNCSASPSSTNLANCSDNSPISVNCTPPPAPCPTSGAGTATVCGELVYDNYRDNLGQTGSSLCTNGASSFSSTYSGNSNCVGATYNCSICRPSTFTLNAPSCPSPGTYAHLSWGASSAPSDRGIIQYNLRINDYNDTNGTAHACISNNPAGDACWNNAALDNSYPTIGGHSYGWWVDAVNNAGSTTVSGANFTCQNTLAAPISADNCTGTPNPGQLNQPITWNVNNVFGGTGTFTYTWSGDDGLSSTTSSTTATSNSVNKTYTTVGTGTKNASVTISSGTVTPITKTCSVTITAPPPTVACSSSPNPANSGTTVTWTATSTGGTAPYSSYSWRFDDGTTSTTTPATSTTSTTTKNYTNTSSTNVTKTAYVKVIDSAGQTSSENSCTVTITAPAIFDYSLTPPADMSVTQGQ